MPLLDLLEREPPRFIRQIDEPEVAGREHGGGTWRRDLGFFRIGAGTGRRLSYRVPNHCGAFVAGTERFRRAM